MTSEQTLKPNSRSIDVAHLPATEWDERSPLWWGNTIGLFIETAMFGILVAIYVTIAMNTDPFPPVRGDRFPVLHDSSPDLFLPIVGLIVLIVSLAPGIWLDISARRGNVTGIKIGLPTTLA